MKLESSNVRPVALPSLGPELDARENALVRYVAARLKAGYSFVAAGRRNPEDYVLEIDRGTDDTYRVTAWRRNGSTAGTKSLTKLQVAFMVRVAIRNARPILREPPLANDVEEELSAALRADQNQESAPGANTK